MGRTDHPCRRTRAVEPAPAAPQPCRGPQPVGAGAVAPHHLPRDPASGSRRNQRRRTTARPGARSPRGGAHLIPQPREVRAAPAVDPARRFGRAATRVGPIIRAGHAAPRSSGRPRRSPPSPAPRPAQARPPGQAAMGGPGRAGRPHRDGEGGPPRSSDRPISAEPAARTGWRKGWRPAGQPRVAASSVINPSRALSTSTTPVPRVRRCGPHAGPRHGSPAATSAHERRDCAGARLLPAPPSRLRRNGARFEGARLRSAEWFRTRIPVPLGRWESAANGVARSDRRPGRTAPARVAPARAVPGGRVTAGDALQVADLA